MSTTTKLTRPARILHALRRAITRRSERRAERANLNRLDHRILKDIGVTRLEFEAAPRGRRSHLARR